MSDHARNTSPTLASPKCSAQTHRGGACRSPAVRGKQGCRMHGGAIGAGSPKDNRNAWKQGLFTKEAIKERRRIEALIGEVQKLLKR